MRQIYGFCRVFVLTLLVMGGTNIAAGYDFVSGNVYYEVNNDGTTVSVTNDGVDYGWEWSRSYCDTVTIPSHVNYDGRSYTVTAIARKAFSKCNYVLKVSIPPTVKEIGDSAFYFCSRMTTANLPEGLTAIHDFTFDHCYSLTGIHLPHSLVTIGKNAFYAGCADSTLTIPNSVVSVGEEAFACCGIKSIDFGNGLKTIGATAFRSCGGLSSLALPPSLENIGDGAFMYCTGLTGIEIPAGVKHIGSGVFQACEKLTRMTVDGRNTTFDAREHCNAIIETATGTLVAGCVATVIPSSVTALGAGAFLECIGLTGITIPPSVTHIGDDAFNYCYDLEEINLPQQLKQIGNYAFAGCEKLVNLTIPDAVSSIGDYAFYDCPWLDYVTLGRSLHYIGKHCFDGCWLTTVTTRSIVPPLMADSTSFMRYGVFSQATLRVPARALAAYRTTDYWNHFPSIIALGDITGDDRTDITDVVSLIDQLLAGNDADIRIADLTNDGRISIDDVTALIDLILSTPAPPSDTTAGL